MTKETNSQTADLTSFSYLQEQEINVVPVALIKPTPDEFDIPTRYNAKPIPSLADLTVEPVQQWIQLPNSTHQLLPLVMVLCSVCYNRYNTPGTNYYMNQAALNTCMTGCT